MAKVGSEGIALAALHTWNGVSAAATRESRLESRKFRWSPHPSGSRPVAGARLLTMGLNDTSVHSSSRGDLPGCPGYRFSIVCSVLTRVAAGYR